MARKKVAPAGWAYCFCCGGVIVFEDDDDLTAFDSDVVFDRVRFGSDCIIIRCEDCDALVQRTKAALVHQAPDADPEGNEFPSDS